MPYFMKNSYFLQIKLQFTVAVELVAKDPDNETY